jgi:hypothetical protein
VIWPVNKDEQEIAKDDSLWNLGCGRWLARRDSGQSARGLAHSRTLRDREGLAQRASVGECGGPPPLSNSRHAFVSLRPPRFAEPKAGTLSRSLPIQAHIGTMKRYEPGRRPALRFMGRFSARANIRAAVWDKPRSDCPQPARWYPTRFDSRVDSERWDEMRRPAVGVAQICRR